MDRVLNHPAIRAFNRVYAPISEEMDMVAHADAQFDGGEWSSEIHGQLAEEEMDRVADRVGARFDMTGAELIDDCEYAAYDEAMYEWGIK